MKCLPAQRKCSGKSAAITSAIIIFLAIIPFCVTQLSGTVPCLLVLPFYPLHTFVQKTVYKGQMETNHGTAPFRQRR